MTVLLTYLAVATANPRVMPAPVVDVETQVLAQMGFRPEIAPRLRDMDARIFREALMGL